MLVGLSAPKSAQNTCVPESNAHMRTANDHTSKAVWLNVSQCFIPKSTSGARYRNVWTVLANTNLDADTASPMSAILS
eukprot:6654402-Lingulodinium_polyedra.AAC.1